MSTIIDALKKTQSALAKRPYSDHTPYGDIEIPNSGKKDDTSHAFTPGQPPHFHFLNKKFKNCFSFSSHQLKNFLATLNRQHIIGSTIILCLCGGIWFGYQYDRQITLEISNVTSNIKKHITTTTPKITTIAAPKKLILNGTILTGSKHDAMINNHLYRVGDMINGYRILEIHYDQVTLLDAETKKTVALTTDLS